LAHAPIDLPELGVSDGAIVESRTTIEIFGLLPDDGDLVISTEDTLEVKYKKRGLGSALDRLLPKASRHNFEGAAARIILNPNEHIAPAVRTCRGSIYRTPNDGRHKCRPYKELKRKFLYYQVTNLEQSHCVNCIWATAC
jgi:hypothetical protein